MKKILVTGATGFIGHPVCRALIKSGRSVTGAVRSISSSLIKSEVEYVSVGDISLKTSWKDILAGIDCIVHCAGRVHKMSKNQDFDLYNLINKEGTRNLAEQAAEAGVKRLIFLSSIKVNGESTKNKFDKINSNNQLKEIFSHTDIPNPSDSYSISKFEAEKALRNISNKTGLEVVVIRLPLVYGYSAPANLERLINLISSRLPLPFSLVNNKRSLIGIDNLVDVILRCIDHPKAKNKTFLVSDDKDLSTPDLIKLIATAMGQPVRLFPVPISWLKFFGFLIGRQSDIDRLTGSLQVDIEYTKKILDWKPSVNVHEGFKRMFNC